MTVSPPHARHRRAARRIACRAAWASGGLAAAGLTALAYASLVELRWFALRHETVPVLRAAARRPLRVLHLSDLHLSLIHISEPTRRTPISYAVFCLKKKKKNHNSIVH